MASMNAFRVLGDVSHTASKCILIWSIRSNRSSEGVSLLTQVTYLFVFLARYLDLFWVPPTLSLWNFVLKVFYITSSVYIVVLMTRVFARTREREKAWKLAAYLNVGTIVATPLVNLVFRDRARMNASELAWTYSIILESVCVLPQLLLLRQTAVPTVIDSFYLVTLGSYRAFYILNWIYRGAFTSNSPDPVSVVFGVVQTAFYLDFAWVYWSRQRVKLRGGGIVDTDDLRKGFLVNRFVNGRNETDEDVEAEGDPSLDHPRDEPSGRPKNVNRWGARGVSISADDTLGSHDRVKAQVPRSTAGAGADSSEQDQFLVDDDDDDNDDNGLENAANSTGPLGINDQMLNSDSQWRK